MGPGHYLRMMRYSEERKPMSSTSLFLVSFLVILLICRFQGAHSNSEKLFLELGHSLRMIHYNEGRKPMSSESSYLVPFPSISLICAYTSI